MRQPTITDYSLLVFLAIIWASAFFNIKLATDSFGPITIAFIRVLLGSLPLIIFCFYKNIKIEKRQDYNYATAAKIAVVVLALSLLGSLT